MNLVDTATGKRINGRISKLSKSELRNLRGSEAFYFDWSLEVANEVYAIYRTKNDELLGLVSLTDVSNELRIHINLIESAIEQQGRKKKVDGIPGCLIGFTCRMAFQRGYDGFVSLIPKTELIDYYHREFGFLRMGASMVIYQETAQSIIQNYMQDE